MKTAGSSKMNTAGSSKRSALPGARMAGLFIILLLAAAPASAVTLPTASGPIDLPGTNFTTAIVAGSFSSTALVFDTTITEFGPFTTAEVAPFILGSSIANGVGLGEGPSGGVPDFIVPGFGDVSIINGPGSDLIVWEAGVPAEEFLFAISTDGGVTFSANISYVPAPVVPPDSSSGFVTNSVFIDLEDFSVAPGERVDAVRLEGLFTGIGGSGPDILALGVINAGEPTGNVPGSNAVPLPSGILLMGAGVLVAAGLGRFRSILRG